MFLQPSRRIAHVSGVGGARQEVLRDPVLVPESGISYERASIERWFQNHSTDPVTQQALVSKLLIPNHALKHSIAAVRDMAFPAGMGRRAAAGSGRDKLARHATAPSPDSSQEEDRDR